MKKREKGDQKKLFLIMTVTIVIVVVLLIFIYPKNCKDIECFNSALFSCRPAKYISEKEEASWLYAIKGVSDNSCLVNIEVLQIKQGGYKLERLHGKDMNCYIPVRVIVDPGDDLAFCHGELKEEIQTLIIQRLHSHIFEHLGEIGEELQELF